MLKCLCPLIVKLRLDDESWIRHLGLKYSKLSSRKGLLGDLENGQVPNCIIYSIKHNDNPYVCET